MSDQPEFLTRDDMIEYLKESLRIEVQTTDEYTGCGDGPMYTKVSTIRLLLEGEVISEAYP